MSNGGIHIGGNVGGNVVVQNAGRDIVGRDNVTSTGMDDATRAELAKQLSDIGAVLRDIKSATEANPNLPDDEKDEIALLLLTELKELKTALQGQDDKPSEDAAPDRVLERLKSTSALLDRVQNLGSKVAAYGVALAPLAATATQLITRAMSALGGG